MTSVIIAIDIPAGEFARAIERETKRIEDGLNRTVDRTLGEIEQAQILSYTSTANPSLRPAQTYERTFTLQSSSGRKDIKTKLPNIEGTWYADESRAKYAQYVIGRRADQARIHRGRWKSLNEVERMIKQRLPIIAQEELR